jgi:hypothetical protein
MHVKFGEGTWLRVFENRVLRKMFGPKREEVTGEWKKLHKKEPYDLYSSSNVTWMIESSTVRGAGHVAFMGAYRILIGNPEGKRPLSRPRRRWKNNIEVESGQALD